MSCIIWAYQFLIHALLTLHLSQYYQLWNSRYLPNYLYKFSFWIKVTKVGYTTLVRLQHHHHHFAFATNLKSWWQTFEERTTKINDLGVLFLKTSNISLPQKKRLMKILVWCKNPKGTLRKPQRRISVLFLQQKSLLTLMNFIEPRKYFIS